MNAETYVITLVELLQDWLKNHVARNPHGTFTVAHNSHLDLDAAVEAVARRFPPPAFPPKWDHALPIVVRVATWLLLADE